MIRVPFGMLCAVLGLAGLAFADYTPGETFDYFDKTSYKDRDWNVSFFENCDMPEYSSTEWVEEDGERFLRFTLKNGQVGGVQLRQPRQAQGAVVGARGAQADQRPGAGPRLLVDLSDSLRQGVHRQ